MLLLGILEYFRLQRKAIASMVGDRFLGNCTFCGGRVEPPLLAVSSNPDRIIETLEAGGGGCNRPLLANLAKVIWQNLWWTFQGSCWPIRLMGVAQS